MFKRQYLMIFTGLIILLTLPILVLGCKQSTDYVDIMTENILIAINEEDFEKLIKDFDEELKNDMSMDVFPFLLAEVIGKAGYYQEGSKQLIGINTEDGVTSAFYSANYENVEDLRIKVVFRKIGNKNKVSGLFFE